MTLENLALKIFTILSAFAVWFYTQKKLAQSHLEKNARQMRISRDFSHELTVPVNMWLRNHRAGSRALLILSSIGVDFLVLYILWLSLMGPDFKPFLGLMGIFILRQICQFFIRLPAPEGILWFHPGFPSLFVTYDVADDFFFSGHTALSVFGGLLLYKFQNPMLGTLGLVLITFEILTVIILRAHWFIDVLAGAIVSTTLFWLLY